MKKVILFFVLILSLVVMPKVDARYVNDEELERIAPGGVLTLNAVKPINKNYADVLWALNIDYDKDRILDIHLENCNSSFDVCDLRFDFYVNDPTASSNVGFEEYQVKVKWTKPNSKIQKIVNNYVKKLEKYSKNHVDKSDVGGPNIAGYELDDINDLKYWANNPKYYNETESEFGFHNIFDSAFDFIPEFKKSFSNYNIDIKFHGSGGATWGPFIVHESNSFSLWYKDVLYFASSQNDPYKIEGDYISNIAISANDVLYVPTDTANTPEALLEAAKKRLKAELPGYNFKIEIGGNVCEIIFPNPEERNDCSFLDEEAMKNNDELYFLKGHSSRDMKYFNITYHGLTKAFFVLRDSSKMKTNNNKVSQDFDTDIKVETIASDVPDDMKVKVDEVNETDDEYNKIKEKINNEFEAYDISLLSGSLDGKVTNTDGSFKVSIPIPDKFKGKKLTVYYINDNGEIEEYKLSTTNNVGSFETNHFSTYILAEVPDDGTNSNSSSDYTDNVTSEESSKPVDSEPVDSEEVPNTLDNSIIYFIMINISIIGIIANSLYLSKVKS